MPTNDYVPFAYSSGANVMSPAAWAGLGARLNGFVSGTALSVQCNTAWRQSSVVSAMIGLFTSLYQANNVVDNGDVTGLENQFEQALQGFLGINNRIKIFTANGSWVVPANITSAVVEVLAGGGGGGTSSWYTFSGTGIIQGNGGGGGGAGGWAFGRVTGLSPGVSIPVTIGPGGWGGIDPNNTSAQPAWPNSNGQAGTASSFGSFITAFGGGGGLDGSQYSTNPTPPPGLGGGAGGSASFGTGVTGLIINGENGCFTGCNHAAGAIDGTDIIRHYYIGGAPAGGWGTISLSQSGGTGSGYGVGGSGATGYVNGIFAGKGASGLVIVRW